MAFLSRCGDGFNDSAMSYPSDAAREDGKFAGIVSTDLHDKGPEVRNGGRSVGEAQLSPWVAVLADESLSVTAVRRLSESDRHDSHEEQDGDSYFVTLC